MSRALIALGLVLAACGGEAGRRPGSRSGTLVVAAPGDGYGLGGDAILGLYPVNTNIHEPLVRLSERYSAEPMLATRWEFLPPNRWRFHLRTGVRFHDGCRSPVPATCGRKREGRTTRIPAFSPSCCSTRDRAFAHRDMRGCLRRALPSIAPSMHVARQHRATTWNAVPLRPNTYSWMMRRSSYHSPLPGASGALGNECAVSCRTRRA